jgi:hypothetical protein
MKNIQAYNMNYTLLRSLLVILIICNFFSLQATDHPALFSDQTKISRSFAAINSSTIELTNKYGTINVNTWEKDSVKFEVTITAESDQLTNVDILIQMAEIEFRQSGSTISAELLWGEKFSALKRSSIEMMLSVNKNHRLRIDYMVYLPVTSALRIENRFGDVNLPELKGKVYLSVMHGDIRAQSLPELRSLILKYGKMNVHSIGTANMELSFADLTADKIGDLTIRSSGSDLIIEEITSMNIQSSNDKINIESIKQLSGAASLSSVRIRNLQNSAAFNCKMGSVVIRKVMKDFSSIQLSGFSSDLTIAFETACAFLFDIIIDQPDHITWPPHLVQITEDQSIAKSRTVSGNYGKGSVKKVTFSGKNCSVKMEEAISN